VLEVGDEEEVESVDLSQEERDNEFKVPELPKGFHSRNN